MCLQPSASNATILAREVVTLENGDSPLSVSRTAMLIAVPQMISPRLGAAMSANPHGPSRVVSCCTFLTATNLFRLAVFRDEFPSTKRADFGAARITLFLFSMRAEELPTNRAGTPD